MGDNPSPDPGAERFPDHVLAQRLAENATLADHSHLEWAATEAGRSGLLVYLQTLSAAAMSEEPRVPRARQVLPVVDPRTMQRIPVGKLFPGAPVEDSARPSPPRSSKALPIIPPSGSPQPLDPATTTATPAVPPPRPSKALPIVAPSASPPSPVQGMPSATQHPVGTPTEPTNSEARLPHPSSPALPSPTQGNAAPAGPPLRLSKALPIENPLASPVQHKASSAPGTSTIFACDLPDKEEVENAESGDCGEAAPMTPRADCLQPLEHRLMEVQAAMAREADAYQAQLQAIDEEYHSAVEEALRRRQRSWDAAAAQHQERWHALASKQVMLETLRDHLLLSLDMLCPTDEGAHAAWLQATRRLQECVLAASGWDAGVAE
eukprot:EG_transcript_16151